MKHGNLDLAIAPHARTAFFRSTDEVVGSGAEVADHADDGDGDGDGPSGRWVLGGFLVRDQAAGHRGFP